MNGVYITAAVLALIGASKGSKGSRTFLPPPEGSKMKPIPIEHFLIKGFHGWNPRIHLESVGIGESFPNFVAPFAAVQVSISDYPIAKDMGFYQLYDDFHNHLFLEIVRKIQAEEKRTGKKLLNALNADIIYHDIRNAWEHLLKEGNHIVHGKYGTETLPAHFTLREFPFITFSAKLTTEIPYPTYVTSAGLASVPPGRTAIAFKLIDLMKKPMVFPAGFNPKTLTPDSSTTVYEASAIAWLAHIEKLKGRRRK